VLLLTVTQEGHRPSIACHTGPRAHLHGPQPLRRAAT
jgi:hypothetical protein